MVRLELKDDEIECTEEELGRNFENGIKYGNQVNGTTDHLFDAK